MADVPAHRKKLARHAADAFGGGKLRVHAYDHDSLPLQIDVLSAAGRPRRGVTSYATIGLSDVSRAEGAKPPFAYELAGAGDSEIFANIMASAAFAVMRGQWFYGKQQILAGAFDEYPEASKTLEHLLLVEPFAWGDGPAPMNVKRREVRWLMAVPISQTERRHAEKKGCESLLARLRTDGVDLFDLSRPSVV